jgi:hypothetical protein
VNHAVSSSPLARRNTIFFNSDKAIENRKIFFRGLILIFYCLNTAAETTVTLR